MRISRPRGLGAACLAAIGALLVGITGCGDEGSGGTVIRGTTAQPVSYDPAGAYDLPSYNAIYSIYQALLTIPPGGTEPEPEAARSCEFTNETTYECTLKDGLRFSDGSPLTAEDVKFSFERNIEMAHPKGASFLLANLERTEAPDPKTVTFHLKAPDVTFPLLITAASFAIVPSDVFPRNKLQPSPEVIGSGRYTLASYEPGRRTVLKANPEYTGDHPPENDRAVVRYYRRSSALKLALERGDVDVAYRSLSPSEIDALRATDGVDVVQGKGIEIRYLVFNQDLQPGAGDAQKLAIRRATAYTIDRESIVDNVYNGTVEPLFSMIPGGVPFATESFKAEYGATPDLKAATAELQRAGVKTPVPLEVWWTPTHYGAASADEYAEIKRQLDGSGLFEVTLKSAEWTRYAKAALTNGYPQFQLGFFPHYPDADDYASNLWGKDAFLNDHYSNPRVERLLTRERASTDDAVRQRAFEQIQALAARDAPTIPYWQGGQIAAVRDNVNGVEDALDSTYIFRFWLISKD
jgi:peptide/nickel transport system substrate-binding protein